MLTYNPGGGARDDIRLLIGDTDGNASERLRLEDAEIDRLISLGAGTSSPSRDALYRIAADACEALATKFARVAEGSPGPDKIQPTSRAAELRATATRYRNEGRRGGAPIIAGISKAENAAWAAETDRNASPFSSGMMDNLRD